MQTYLKQIEAFLLSPSNIFTSTSLDYPTNWQQQLIISYFHFKQTLQKQHNQIIRELNTQSQKQLLQISQGCLYLLLIDSTNMQRLGQYLMILRIDVWNMIGQQLVVMLAEYGDMVKLGYLVNMRMVVDRLMMYNMCDPFLLCLMGNIVNYYDRSPEMLAVIRSILQMFVDKLEEDAQLDKDIKTTLFLYLFPKILRINPYIEQKLCTKLVTLMYTKYPIQCLSSSKQIQYIIESEPKCLELPHIYQLYRNVKDANDTVQYLREEQEIIFSYLPRRVQLVFQFIFKENVKGGELNCQLGWLQKSWYNKKYYYLDIMVDIARWTAYSPQFIEQRITILDWILKRVCNTPAFQKVKRAIFSNWFVKNIYYSFERALTSLILLRHFLTTDARMAVDMLRFILKYKSEFAARIQQILETAIKLNHFNIEFILDNRLIPEIVQQDFLQILQPPKKPISSALEFNPDSPVKSEDEQIINYNLSSSVEESSPIVVPVLMSNQVGELFVDEDYVHEFRKLEDLLDNPNYENFVDFFKEFAEIGEQNRTSNKGFIDILVKQTARILYCAYNNQFQDLNQPVPADQSIITYIISLLLKSWHQVTYKIILIKNLVKKLFQLFPTAEVSFWYYFFTQFQYGGVNNRQFKNWLVPKQKSDMVVKAVQTLLGRNDENLRKKISKYSVR